MSAQTPLCTVQIQVEDLKPIAIVRNPEDVAKRLQLPPRTQKYAARLVPGGDWLLICEPGKPYDGFGMRKDEWQRLLGFGVIQVWDTRFNKELFNLDKLWE